MEQGGETELLITSLTDSRKYNHTLFKELYFRRWKIETYFDELKNKLGIEHFSGYSNQSILQDFYAAAFVSNLQSLIVAELAEELQENTSQNKIQLQSKHRFIIWVYERPDPHCLSKQRGHGPGNQ